MGPIDTFFKFINLEAGSVLLAVSVVAAESPAGSWAEIDRLPRQSKKIKKQRNLLIKYTFTNVSDIDNSFFFFSVFLY